jgi:hypothetical protein
MMNQLVVVKHNKLVQFATLFHALKHGGPMFEFEVHKDLFDFLSLEENLKMHWTHNFGWAMVQHMHGIILEVTKSIVGIAQYLSFICDEVSTIDNQNWLLVHAYVVQNWL